MKAVRRSMSGVAACILALAIATPATATAAAATYHGVFVGPVEYGCVAPAATASGTWNVTTRGDTATMTVNIQLDGKHHVAFGGTFPTATATGETFAIETTTLAGPLRVSLDGDALTYRIEPYDLSAYGGISCPGGVTYSGLLSRGGG